MDREQISLKLTLDALEFPLRSKRSTSGWRCRKQFTFAKLPAFTSAIGTTGIFVDHTPQT